MLADNDRVDNQALFFILIAGILETGLLEGPRGLAQVAGANAWLVSLLNIIPASICCFFLVRLGQLFPGETFPEYSPKIVGRWVSYFICFMLIAYWIVANGRVLRGFSGLIKTFLLFRTPIEVIMISFLLAAAYLARGGIEAIARFSIIATLISIPIGTILILATYSSWDLNNLLPLFEKGWLPVILESGKSVGIMEGLESLLILLAFVRKPQKALPYCLGGVLSTFSVFFFMLLATQLSFGPEETSRLVIPGISLIQSAVLPGRFLERLGSIYVSIWIILLFPTITLFLYLPGVVLAKIFKLHESRPLIFYLIPLVYVIALSFPNRQALQEFGQKINLINIGVIAGIPILFYLIARLRGYKGGKNDNT